MHTPTEMARFDALHVLRRKRSFHKTKKLVLPPNHTHNHDTHKGRHQKRPQHVEWTRPEPRHSSHLDSVHEDLGPLLLEFPVLLALGVESFPDGKGLTAGPDTKTGTRVAGDSKQRQQQSNKFLGKIDQHNFRRALTKIEGPNKELLTSV